MILYSTERNIENILDSTLENILDSTINSTIQPSQPLSLRENRTITITEKDKIIILLLVKQLEDENEGLRRELRRQATTCNIF